MEATQESTQPTADPRRMGLHNSGLHDQDLADIICILHPNSHAAHDAVAATASLGTQHILQQAALDYESSETAALDVALRLSSDVHDLSTGFCFGRNSARCDVLLASNDDAKKVSNCHFRIHLTGDGIIMLQDTSTNGTIVDNCRLRKNSKDNSRMLVNGSVIQVVTGSHGSDEVRFIVRIPSRENFAVKYTQNVLQYFQRVQAALADAGNNNGRPVPTQPVLPWSVGNAFGMHWTGSPMYNVTGQIGKGAFATVYKIATKQHGSIYAAKELDKRRFMRNGILDQKVDNEMKIMRDLKHPNIVQYIDHHEHDRWIYIIMEYVPGGELSTFLQSPGKIPEEMVQTITRQLLRALHYLHQRRITHRDIKPDNILIASLDPLRVKISDFGLSKVTQEETFLKTFCGTLLYCAPEVYPDYETYRIGEARKRRRVGDPPPKTSPYSQAVDMWSLGAVLYHILCGLPPFQGRAEDRGVAMLRSIMTSEADYNILRQAGISECGIDFVSKLLNRDPFARPTEKECFQHPWIVDVADVDEYDDDELLDDPRDGLSVIGEDDEGELDASQLSLHDNGLYGYQAGADEESSQEGLAKRPRIEHIPADIRYPSLPRIESFQESQVAADHQARRLFGEITPSALRSSHALGNPDAWNPDSHIEDFASSGESMSDERSVYSVVSLPEHPFGGIAPSLMGAENLVGRLNMNSSHPILHPEIAPINEYPFGRKYGPPIPFKTRPPRRPRELEQGSPVDSNSTCLRQPANNPVIRVPSKVKLPYAPPGHTPEAQLDIELLTTIDERTGKAILAQQMSAREAETSDIIVHRPDPPSIPSQMPNDDFARPPKLLGRLKSVPGSIFDLNLRLEGRMTSWGRGSLASVVHEDSEDTRIPAYALEITFHAPGISGAVAKGEDWMQLPGLETIVSTKTSKCIWVNGTELRRATRLKGGSEGLNYGTVYTGDIITIYRRKDKYLDLECEFYHGESAQTRPVDEAEFTIKQIPASKPLSNRMPLRPTQVNEAVA
ncbi:uncharacterized protein N7483_004139 [Penicillium malachiteum]|uniref:uncharacterized protein n=1 Tax=Penicillium malachiteum TaxID=1324776 RepID=UPI0025471801|nr:uncharacterized protein N7483_004139 [Penicillium malachiteum]KAJ5729631.1 hypothetical protein N7483_004139 [Penicillium malachiteum]